MSNIVSLSAFRATHVAVGDPRKGLPVVDVDGWYHREEIVKTTQKSTPERQG